MHSIPTRRILAVVLLSFLLSACASNREAPVSDRSIDGLTPEELADLDRQRAEAEAAAARASAEGAADRRRALSGEELDRVLDDPTSAISRRTIFFAFDSSEISASDMDLIEAHARFLAEHPDQRIIIEGHTDDRGSAEYNLALGQRRAQAVLQALELSGAAADQLRAVSYGEEQPAEFGTSEAVWAANRRAVLLYRDLF